MKRFVVISLSLTLLVAAPGTSTAIKGPPGVAAGAHNLSFFSSTAYQTDEPELCVFCHTPHGASSAGPLWNKPLTSGPFVQYTTDLGGNAELQNSGRLVSDQSKLCLACHDGTASLNTVINLPNSRNGALIANFMSGETLAPGAAMNVGFGAYNPVLDIDLTNDHPISFSYDQVLTDFTAAGLANKLRTVAQAQAAGVRFFATGNYVECSSCHDPHVDYSASGDPNYLPFLITPNNNSALCLACHNK